MKILIKALLVVSVVFAAGCATSPKIDQYPRRFIDRPYTLPKGIAAYNPSVGGQYSRDTNNSNTFWIANPLVWQTPVISDDWNIIWNPLPLGLMRQLLRTDSDIWGASFLLGGYYSSTSGFRLSPTLSSTYRHIFETSTHWLGSDLRASYTPQIPFKSGTDFSWQAGFDLGPYLQLCDGFAVVPRVGLTVQRDYYSDFTSSTSFAYGDVAVTMPLSLSLLANLSRQWDIGSEYIYRHVGYSRSFYSHQGTLSATFRW